MKGFLTRIIIFLIIPICFLFIGIVLPAYPGASNTYLFAGVDKDSLLAKSKPQRIILVGGSNLALSMNSQMLFDSLHMNPVNTGLDCNVGLAGMISNTLSYVQKNDVVLISVEYEQFFGRLLYGGYPCPVIEFEVSPWHLQRLSINEWVNLCRYTPGYAFGRLKVWKYFTKPEVNVDRNYMRTSFNRYGDHVTHWNLPGRNPISTKEFAGTYNQKAIGLLVDFQKKLQEKEAVLLITYPPYQSSSFNNTLKQISQVVNAMQSAPLNIISTPETYMMPDSLMFDSPYHLIKAGIDKRTQLVVSDIKKYFTIKGQHLNGQYNNL